ncbi:hypothetical protein [Legionella pneumophila]|uniref:hypothetical protein n=1 Tax=Legionella pneumophila TaxID=446 RepID=UPI0028080F2E|nr:DUF1845 family protein [Legionella pneumophila]HDU8595212.1 DUF1845 family protein [Legionella pneumophila]
MKAEITLNLRTREVYKLFERKISGDRLFIDAILHKMNIIISRCHKQDSAAFKVLYEMEKLLDTLIQEFVSETKRFEALLFKKKEFKDKQINFVVQFHPKIIISNPTSEKLVALIEAYDLLVALMKLLHLCGCFDSNNSYLNNVRNLQKTVNKNLSHILLSRIKEQP